MSGQVMRYLMEQQAKARSAERGKRYASSGAMAGGPAKAAGEGRIVSRRKPELTEASLEAAVIAIAKQAKERGKIIAVPASHDMSMRIRTIEDDIREAVERLVDKTDPVIGNHAFAPTEAPYIAWAMGWGPPNNGEGRECLAHAFIEDATKWVTSVRSVGGMGFKRPSGWIEDLSALRMLGPAYLYWRALPSFEVSPQGLVLRARLLVSVRWVERGDVSDYHLGVTTSDGRGAG